VFELSVELKGKKTSLTLDPLGKIIK
jgi:hypothetical protein